MCASVCVRLCVVGVVGRLVFYFHSRVRRLLDRAHTSASTVQMSPALHSLNCVIKQQHVNVGTKMQRISCVANVLSGESVYRLRLSYGRLFPGDSRP